MCEVVARQGVFIPSGCHAEGVARSLKHVSLQEFWRHDVSICSSSCSRQLEGDGLCMIWKQHRCCHSQCAAAQGVAGKKRSRLPRCSSGLFRFRCEKPIATMQAKSYTTDTVRLEQECKVQQAQELFHQARKMSEKCVRDGSIVQVSRFEQRWGRGPNRRKFGCQVRAAVLSLWRTAEACK